MALDELFDKVKEGNISRRNVLKIGIGVGVGLVGLGAAGCTTPTPTATPLPGVTATPAPLKSMSGIGHLPSDHHAALFIANNKGADGKSIFDKHGLTVTASSINTGPGILQQLEAGSIDIAMAGVPPTISSIDKPDSTTKIVAALQSNGSGIIISKNYDISGLKDIKEKVEFLKGKKIAIPSAGSIQDIMLRELFKKYDIDYSKDVTITAVPAGQQVGAVQAGTQDAAINWEPFVSTAVVKGAANVLLRSEEIWPNHPCCCVSTSTKMIKDYPETLEAFFLAIKEANDFIKSNPEESARIVATAIQGDDVAIETEAMPHIAFLVKPDETFITGSETYARTMKDLGLTKNNHDRNDLFDLTLVNKTL